MQLKCFRKECTEAESAAAIADIEDDIVSGVIQRVGIDWDEVWPNCQALARMHAAATGCLTLDTLHVACARSLGLREFVTADKRQIALAELCGLKTVNPIE